MITASENNPKLKTKRKGVNTMKNTNNTKRSRTVKDISAQNRSGKQGEYNDNVYNTAKRPCNSADAFFASPPARYFQKCAKDLTDLSKSYIIVLLSSLSNKYNHNSLMLKRRGFRWVNPVNIRERKSDRNVFKKSLGCIIFCGDSLIISGAGSCRR